MQNNMRLIIPAKSQNESFARSAVAAFCTESDPSVEDINDIKTAVSEAVTNAVVHAYRHDETKNVEITATLIDDGVDIEVRDDGVGIADVEKAREPFFTTESGGERSGMGFTIMETFMDSVGIDSAPGRGTVIKMRKTFKRSANVC